VPQFLSILMKEPRFLSIAPDLGLVDLEADETGPVITHVSQQRAQRDGKTDLSQVAIPLVTGAWYNQDSHVEAPVLYTKSDGTQVTNFPDSLALWANVTTTCQPRQGPVDTEVSCTSPTTETDDDNEYSQTYWQSIRTAIRQGEVTRTRARAPSEFASCDPKARFGVSPDMARLSTPLSRHEWEELLMATNDESSGGWQVDWKGGQLTQSGRKPTSVKEEL